MAVSCPCTPEDSAPGLARDGALRYTILAVTGIASRVPFARTCKFRADLI